MSFFPNELNNILHVKGWKRFTFNVKLGERPNKKYIESRKVNTLRLWRGKYSIILNGKFGNVDIYLYNKIKFIQFPE